MPSRGSKVSAARSRRATTRWLDSKITVWSSVSQSLTCGDALGEVAGDLKTASNALLLCKARRLSWSPALRNLLSRRLAHALRLLTQLEQSYPGAKSIESLFSSAPTEVMQKGLRYDG